jgi:hypothetical protein
VCFRIIRLQQGNFRIIPFFFGHGSAPTFQQILLTGIFRREEGNIMKKAYSSGRRHFLKAATAGTAAMVLQPGIGKVFAASESSSPSPLNKWPGRVAINFNKAVVSNDAIDLDVLAKMMEQTITLLTGKDDVGEAWKSVFPDTLTATSKIAVKVICYNPYKVGLNWQTVKGVTDGLQKMVINGVPFPAANIIIYELTTSPTKNAFTVAGYTAANFPGITLTSDKSKKIKTGDGALGDREYASALKEADFLINCFNTRGHAYGDNDGKFTLGFKSHFGTYTNPNGMHGTPAGSAVSKNIREITCVGPVYKKHVLSVCGGIFGSNEGNGPGGIMGTDDLKPEDFSTYVKTIDSTAGVKNPSTIIMSTDPVAAEMQAIKILRSNKKKSYAPSDLPAYLQSAAGVDKPGFSPTYNIGIMDEAKMTICKMINDVAITTTVNASRPGGRWGAPVDLSVHPIGGSGSLYIEFRLPESFKGKEASIEVYAAGGTLLRTLSHRVMGIDNHLSWDYRNRAGDRVAGGMYVARLVCGSVRSSTRFMVL